MISATTFSAAVKEVAEKFYSVSQAALSKRGEEIDSSRYKILKNKSSNAEPIAFLVSITVAEPVIIIPLLEGVNKIGRGDNADIVYGCKKIVIEGHQWEISVCKNEARVRDWNSSNGSLFIPNDSACDIKEHVNISKIEVNNIHENFSMGNLKGILIPYLNNTENWLKIGNFYYLVNAYSIFMFAYIRK